MTVQHIGLKRGRVFLITVLLSGCGNLNTLNSFSSDSDIFNTSLSPQFFAVRTLINNKCSRCHSEFVSYTESEWLSSGLINAKSPNTSTLYLRLKNNGVGGDQDMPPDSSLSTEQATAFKDWINSL